MPTIHAASHVDQELHGFLFLCMHVTLFLQLWGSAWQPFRLPELRYNWKLTITWDVSLLYFTQVRSAGALIKYIDKKRIGVEMEDPDVRVPILGLKVFSL